MRWLFFVFAAACFAATFQTASLGIAMVCLFLALVLALAGVFSIASARIQNQARSETALLGPELALRQKPSPAAAAATPATATSAGDPTTASAGDTGETQQDNSTHG